MYKKNWLLLLFICLLSHGFSQERAFQIYSSKGKNISYSKVIKQLQDTDIFFFGEYHDNPICHWLELEITKSLSQESNLILGAEMFERDNQEQLNSFLKDTSTLAKLDSTVRLWNNYDTDYAPLVNFAKASQFPFVATNIPRRFAKEVYYHGIEVLDSLPASDKKFIVPLPMVYDSNLACYKSLQNMMPLGHSNPNLPLAQAIKDATMAYSIINNLDENSIFIHYNGSYHSNHHEGIVWYVRQEKPNLKIYTLATVSQKNINSLEESNIGLADFILVVDDDMCKTN